MVMVTPIFALFVGNGEGEVLNVTTVAVFHVCVLQWRATLGVRGPGSSSSRFICALLSARSDTHSAIARLRDSPRGARCEGQGACDARHSVVQVGQVEAFRCNRPWGAPIIMHCLSPFATHQVLHYDIVKVYARRWFSQFPLPWKESPPEVLSRGKPSTASRR